MQTREACSFKATLVLRPIISLIDVLWRVLCVCLRCLIILPTAKWRLQSSSYPSLSHVGLEASNVQNCAGSETQQSPPLRSTIV